MRKSQTVTDNVNANGVTTTVTSVDNLSDVQCSVLSFAGQFKPDASTVTKNDWFKNKLIT